MVRLLPGDIFIVFIFDLVFWSYLLPRVSKHLAAPRAQASSRMKNYFSATSCKRTMTQMLIFLLAPKKPGFVAPDSHCVGDSVAHRCRQIALLWMCNWSVIVFSSQCRMVEASLVTMKMMIFSALPRLSLWYQLFILRRGEDRKQMLS